MTQIKKPNPEERIKALLQKVRPYIQMHGGDVHYMGFKDGIVSLKIDGSCAHCSLADLTYNNLIAGLLREEIPEVKDIVLEK